MNHFASALSTQARLKTAVDEVVQAALQEMDGHAPDLAMVFVSHDHAEDFSSLAGRISAATGARYLLGSSGETVVGRDREVENGPALSLWLAHLPGSRMQPFQLSSEVRQGEMVIHGTPDWTRREGDGRHRSVLVIGEPFSFPADQWLGLVNTDAPGMPVFGGMASGGRTPGDNALLFGSECVREGAVGIVLDGVPVRHVVSQGCRPIGRSMVITSSQHNVIETLAGKPPLDQLRLVFEECEESERLLLQQAARTGSLHLGQVVNELIEQPGRGDYLVRSVLGTDQRTGAMMIGDVARRGRSVRFHVRDGRSAHEDLSELLARPPGESPWNPKGALLFTCNGRGTRLFGEPDHDARCIGNRYENLPLAGFFAQGEIGPVGGRNFLHGFTASVALFGEHPEADGLDSNRGA